MFTFTDSQERIYPNLLDADGNVLVVQPGQSYALAADPGDGRWTAVASAPVAPAPAEAPQSAPEAPVAPEVTPTDPTPSN